ncbi:hypothetical protein GO495_08235 [Chitinophaga oryziterrae]|uniref:Uncharacterized protein n=1 Tax=Chitinophaga oryziterrae TaxID=1031224 RepID=A0A6N8J7N6_9BACT|nr:hypothetical protein [Chitinophaga oryziterrae]MVT40568.1 hypothetical protein [Chitinophaga oryziterrae]
MKLATLLFFLTCMQVYAKSYAQEKISLQLKETSILQLLKAVEKQTSYRFVYHNESLKTCNICKHEIYWEIQSETHSKLDD